MHVQLDALCARVDVIVRERGRAFVAIDGPCASGKTTLGGALAARFGTQALHMDDFFLQPHQRTPQRLAQPGGNVDYERFEAEVLLPLSRGEEILYRRFDCGTQRLLPGVRVTPGAVTVVEGSYSLHPALAGYYDLRVLLDIDPKAQSARILAREGAEKHRRFLDTWIPLENLYFERTDIKARCDMRLIMEENK